MTESSPASKGKNILIFSDGTGQEGGEGNNTNVYKLFQMVEDRTDAQIAFYDAGLGTGWRKLTGNAVGAGISRNILECYQFLSDHYQWGDRIFLFGFSRGATTVRSLAGFVSWFGILPHSRPDLAKKAWKIYRTSSGDTRRTEANKFLEQNTTTWCNIDFLGVWDTVEALGLPFKAADAIWDRIPFLKHSFHDLRISKCVNNAFHALAIDEDRAPFRPTPWQTHVNGESVLGDVLFDPRDGDESEQAANTKQGNTKQTVRQVWICGVHTDVGGGYAETGLSDISLTWMIDRATDRALLKHPLRLFPHNSVTIDEQIEGVIHSERDTWAKQRLFPEGRRTWDPKKAGQPVIHASVLERTGGKTGAEAAPYKPWILEEFSEEEREIEPWNADGWTRSGIGIEVAYRTARGAASER